ETKSAFPERVGSEVAQTESSESGSLPPGTRPETSLSPQSTSALAALTITITASKTLPQAYGTAITWTATATGGTAPYTYLFWRMDAGTWKIVQNYSASNAFTWTPAAGDVGSHTISVWVKNAGSANSYDAYKLTSAFNIVAPATISALTASPTLPRPVGTKITFTATATGVPGPLEYRFWRKDGSTWNMVQDYSASKSYAWTTAAADIGNHDLTVWVRNVGSGVSYQAWKEFGVF